MTSVLAAAEYVGFDPSDSVDLWYAFIIGLPALVAAAATVIGQRKARERWERQARQSEEIHYEVRNDHRSNLRDDIDKLGDAIREGFHETRKEIGALREELLHERVERIEGDRILHAVRENS